MKVLSVIEFVVGGMMVFWAIHPPFALFAFAAGITLMIPLAVGQ